MIFVFVLQMFKYLHVISSLMINICCYILWLCIILLLFCAEIINWIDISVDYTGALLQSYSTFEVAAGAFVVFILHAVW